jgi:hypothetical protein
MSAMLTKNGAEGVRYPRLVLNEPSPKPISTEMLSVLRSPATTSGMSSPFRSAMATVIGELPAKNSARGNMVPSPCPNHTVEEPLAWFAVTTSRIPSRFRSATATENGRPLVSNDR